MALRALWRSLGAMEVQSDTENHPVLLFLINREKTNIFVYWSISAAITSWKDFHTTAPTYFFMGNPFPIDLRVFGHSIGRLHDPNVVKADKKISCNSVEM